MVLACKKKLYLSSWIGADDLDKAESLIRSDFEDIRNTNRNSIIFPGQPCDSENLQVLIEVSLVLKLNLPSAKTFFFLLYCDQYEWFYFVYMQWLIPGALFCLYAMTKKRDEFFTVFSTDSCKGYTNQARSQVENCVASNTWNSSLQGGSKQVSGPFDWSWRRRIFVLHLEKAGWVLSLLSISPFSPWLACRKIGSRYACLLVIS